MVQGPEVAPGVMICPLQPDISYALRTRVVLVWGRPEVAPRQVVCRALAKRTWGNHSPKEPV